MANIKNPEIDEAELGPAMLALNDRQRRFVRAVLELGKGGVRNLTKAAEIAGYSARSYGSLRVRAHELAHDERVQDAMLEEARRDVNFAAAAYATPVVVEIALNKALDARDRLRACEMLFNRGGMPALTEHKVTVSHRIDHSKMKEIVTQLARDVGIDPVKLLGANVIDGEAVPVRRDELPAQR